jgi:ABC-2 type transport system ATP-binding protein
MHPPVITTYGAELNFGRDTGVFDLSFDVPHGSIFGLIGPSGCGKTTTLRLLTGLYKPDTGSVRVLGQKPYTFPARVRERIGYMPQKFVLYPNLTVQENMTFVASLYGMGFLRRRKRIKEVLTFVELMTERRKLCRRLSGGMQRRLELACALVHDPQLIFADEPTAGVDPVLRGKFWEHFRYLRDEGRTLFVTTQYTSEAVHCDLVGVMRQGRLLYVDTPDGLRRRALQGEIVQLLVREEDALETVQVLRRHQIARHVGGVANEPGLIHIRVDDAGEAIPVLFHELGNHDSIHIRQMEAYQPPFDDIFIALMEQTEQTEQAGTNHV